VSDLLTLAECWWQANPENRSVSSVDGKREQRSVSTGYLLLHQFHRVPFPNRKRPGCDANWSQGCFVSSLSAGW